MQDCLLCIFSYFNKRDTVNCSSVSRHFNKTANCNTQWKMLLIRSFNYDNQCDNYKDRYKDCRQLHLFTKKYCGESFYSLSKTKDLNLQFQNLNTSNIPNSISLLTNLVDLSLRQNNLSELPIGMFALTKLEILDLGVNNLKVISPEIVLLTNLQRMLLSDNMVEVLPPEIGLLTNLTALGITRNSLKELPNEIGLLTNLSTLRLDLNPITTLPNIKSLTNLSNLIIDKVCAGNMLRQIHPALTII